MKFIYTFIFGCFLIQMQAQELGPHLISTAGSVIKNQDCILYSAIGEGLNTQISFNDEKINQGVLPSIYSGGMLDSNNESCTNNQGQIFFQNCDDGVEYFFINSNGQILDPYYDVGINFNHAEGQNVNFGFRDADFETPCSFADKAVIITCIEEVPSTGFAMEPGEYNYSGCQAETFTFDVSIPSGPGGSVNPCSIMPGVISGDLQNINWAITNENEVTTLSVTVYADCTFSYEVDVAGNDINGCNVEWIFNINIDPTCNPDNIDESYPWIFDLEYVDPLNCEGVTISEFELDGQTYIYIVTEDSAIIYSPSGMPNCITQPDGSTECATLEDFGLSDPIHVWDCPTDVYVPNCALNAGTIFFQNCDDGVEYFFIDAGEDVIYDPYYAEGVDFEHEDGMKINYDFTEATFDTPCSVANKAIIITCIQENTSVSTDELVLDKWTIDVFPNPATDQVIISAPWLTETHTKVEILNSVGSVVLKPSLDFSHQKNGASLNVESLKSGIYFLNIVKDGNPVVEKLIIAN